MSEAIFSSPGIPAVAEPAARDRVVISAQAPAGRAYGRLYLTVGLLFGLAMTFLTPVGQVPDEAAHFWRTYQLCRSHLIGEPHDAATSGGHIPIGVAQLAPITTRLASRPDSKLHLDEYQADWAVRVDRDPTKRIFADFHSYVVYSPVGYLPQIVGVKLSELFSDRLLVIFYGARLANLFVALLVTYLAIRLAPCAHASLCLLALCPGPFSQMCSASADAFTNACALFFFSLFLRAAVGNKPLSPLGWLGIFAPLLVVTQMKFPYIGLTLLLLALPKEVFGSTRRRWLTVAVIGGACFVAYLGWYAAVRHLSVPGRPEPGISVPKQMAFIVHHPFHFLGAFLHSLNIYGRENAFQFVGVFGWLDTHLPQAFYLAYGCFLLVTWALEAMPAALLTLSARFCAAAAFGLSTLTIFAFIYMYWNPVGYDDVVGFQGRYLVPVALTLTLLLNFRNTRDERDLRPRLLFTGTLGVLGLLVMMGTVALRFYPL